MTSHTDKQTTTDKVAPGSIYNVGDRVVFKYYEDEECEEYVYGTLHGRVDEETAIVKVVLKGRKKDIIDYHEIAFSNLLPHIPDKRRQAPDDDDE